MLDLQHPVKASASAMGEALAIIHWAARVDAYHIEFVLGSERKTSYTDLSVSLSLTVEQLQAMPPHTDIESLLRNRSPRRTTTRRLVCGFYFNLCSTWD